MLKNIQQSVVLLVFSVLMIEVLTPVTLVFVALGLGLTLFNIRTNNFLRNAVAMGVFGSYWLTYGKIIDPEVGLNFLTSIIVLKMLERETKRDGYMIFFGLLLLISAGSLFQRSLTYVFFFSISFFILIREFYDLLGQKLRPKEIASAMVWVFPFTFFLFFMIPRLIDPIPFQQNSTGPGEIGYTADVIISDIDRLEPNPSPVFSAQLSSKINFNNLYWRGNTLSYNDGWNWREIVQDKGELQYLLAVKENEGIRQSIRLFTRPDYFFSLDYPKAMIYSDLIVDLSGPKRTLAQNSWSWVQNYEVISDVRDVIQDRDIGRNYLTVNLPKREKAEIKKLFPGQTLDDVAQSIKRYFTTNSFVYTLSPGKSAGVMDFLKNKRGLCSHYASASAIIFRLKGFPSRLVSGYMGGTLNPYANYYLVTQNDAHVWVEVFEKGVWRRIDPTGWIAPDRLALGGAAFVSGIQEGLFKKNSSMRLFKFLNDAKLWFEHLDFKFYQWLEKMDYQGQEAILAKLNFRREWLFSFIPLFLVVFISGYLLFLNINTKIHRNSPHQELWSLYFKKMKKKGVILSTVSLKESALAINKLEDPFAEDLWKKLISMTFEGKDISFSEMKKKIKKL